MRRWPVVLALLAALAGAPAAMAEVVTSQDLAGRTITFDVRAENVDVEWYAEQLRSAAHGEEIQRVRFVIVTDAELRDVCGAGAGGCYRSSGEPTIVVPAGSSAEVRHTLIHEYGHHIDRNRGVAANTREPNGSASWWEARGIAQLLAEGKVSRTYLLGWERAIGEIFAEDYAQLHLETPFRIQWLDPPTSAVRAALAKDLENVPAVPLPAAPKAPVVVSRTGRLATATKADIPFELLGPDRRVTFTAAIKGIGARAKMELRCSDGRTAARVLSGARRSATIDLRELGPARCTVSVRNTGKTGATYSARVRLSVERPGL